MKCCVAVSARLVMPVISYSGPVSPPTDRRL
uniref:Uncharacterized protein n=1 Tax=Anguilla anguilla TaxID=7936 RepID=A0A0E9U0F0_ANGAN